MTNENVDPLILLPILKKIPLFKDLDEDLHYEIIKRINMMYYPPNYVIFREGDAGNAMYLIKNGAVEIYHEPREQGDLPTKVANIGEGGFFGEMALVSSENRNASAKSTTECQLFVLNREDFNQLMQSNPTLAEQVSATVVSRLEENDKKQ